MTATADAPCLRSLRAALGDAAGGALITDPDLMAAYLVDWTRRYQGSAIAVARPTTTSQVAAVVRACADAGIAVVPQGGNTGLVGGAVPHGRAVVLSTHALQELGPVDRVASQITAGAGVTLERLQGAARAAGLRFAVDLAARGSATVGGLVATNAGGLAVLRFGTMRAQIVGIEAVLADGSVVERLGGLLKDNTGYDLAGLLCGSEGTLGVVTRARLRLVPQDAARRTVAIGLARLVDAVHVLAALRARGVAVDACELVRRAGVELVAAHVGRRPPEVLGAPYAVLFEVAGHDEDRLESQVVAALDDPGALEHGDVVVAPTPAMAVDLWSWRERHTEALAACGVPVKLDVSLPLDRLAAFEADLDATVSAAWPDAVTHVFGHVGDGNLHVNVLGPEPSDGEGVARVEDAVLRRVVALGGSISAEHGIGRMKARWLPLDRSPAELAAMRSIKQALDPQGVLNPGVLLGAAHPVP